MIKACFLVISLLLTGCGLVKPTPIQISQAYYGEKPTKPIEAVKAFHKNELYDPSSAIVRCEDSTRKAWVNELGNLSYGWIINCEIKSKQTWLNGEYDSFKKSHYLFNGNTVVKRLWATQGYIDSTVELLAPEVINRVEFNVFDHESYQLSGTGKITGQAFLTTRGGDVKLGAGKVIYLYPATSYALDNFKVNELIELNESEKNIKPLDVRFSKLRRETIADAQGNFEFIDLPAGEYYLNTKITWSVPGRRIMETTGGSVTRKVEVKTGGTIKALLTD